MHPRLGRLDDLAAHLATRGDALAVLALGSAGAEHDRLDEHSARGFSLPRKYTSSFDIQGHRGAHAVRPENTLPAFEYAFANPAVSTLELDTGVTADGHLVVIHDRTINGSHCQGQYVGRLVHELTLAQIKTLDCGSLTLPEFPRQVAVPGSRIPTLDEVFDLVRRSGRTDIRMNIETKINPLVNDADDPDLLVSVAIRYGLR